MVSLFKTLSRLPLWLLHGLGGALGWGVFLASSTYRRRFLANARLAGFGWPQWRGAVSAAGKLVGELPRLWFGAPLPIEWHGTPLIDQALAGGRGIVFLTPHMGCFEVTAQGYAREFGPQHGPITVLFRPARQRWLRAVVAQARQRPGLATAPTTLAGVKQMLKALKAGQAIGLLPDQVPPLGMGVWTPFFGQPAYTMTLAARMVQQTGAQVLLAWGERMPGGRGFKLHLSALEQPLSSQVEEAVRQINQAMERLIAQCPGQYLWGYARYKQPREER